MKRRNFLIGSSATIASFAALRGANAAQPCPPPNLSIPGGVSVITTCDPPLTGNAPAWYTAMGDMTWTTIAASGTVLSQTPSPNPGGTGFDGIITAWCGACFDTKRQELVIPAQGGHSDYYGNEVYVLGVAAEAPTWKRVTNPRYSFGSDGATMDDGSPRSFHGNSHLCYAANVDKTYIAPLIFTAPYGNTTGAVFAFDRATGTWTRKADVPSTFGSSSGNCGGAVYDAGAGAMWVVGAQADSSVSKFDPVANTHTMYNVPLQQGYSGSLAISTSRRMLIYIGGSMVTGGVFKYLDLTNISAGWNSPAGVSGTAPSGYGVGAVWHEASAAFLCWDGSPSTGTIKKLTPPATPSSGTWTWSDVAPASGNSVTPTARASNGSFGRFNLVANIGGSTRDALVVLNAVDQPTYVYKLPVGGI